MTKPVAAEAASIDDRATMAFGIPAFGLAIPLLTGLYGDLSPAEPLLWAGVLCFMALSAAIWFGNRWLLFRQREHLDWFGQPARKLVLLVAAHVLYTAPLTVAVLAAWYAARGVGVDWPTIQLVTLTNVVCVLVVTHAYETVFLIREREGDLTRVERLERMRVEAELAALTAQLDPHFLFNSLNTLGHVIGHDPARARDFCDRLAEVYRYVLAARGRQLVPLADELQFLANCHALLRFRFGDAIGLAVDAGEPAEAGTALLPPLALQTLLENAVKHNRLDPAEAPLVVEVRREGERIRVAHAARPRSSVVPGAGLGLANLDERCRLLAGRGIVVERGGGRFSVVVPLLCR